MYLLFIYQHDGMAWIGANDAGDPWQSVLGALGIRSTGAMTVLAALASGSTSVDAGGVEIAGKAAALAPPPPPPPPLPLPLPPPALFQIV